MEFILVYYLLRVVVRYPLVTILVTICALAWMVTVVDIQRVRRRPDIHFYRRGE